MHRSGGWPASGALGEPVSCTSSDCTFSSNLLHAMVTLARQRSVRAGSHRFGCRAEVMHATVVQRTAHALSSISAMHAYLGVSSAAYWTTFVMQAAWRQHCALLGKARQIIVDIIPLPSLLGFSPYRCRLRPAVTPKVQARSDLLHLDERPLHLRMLPVLFGIAPLRTQLVEYHFSFYNGGGSTRARLDRWAGTDTTLRIDCPYVIDRCAFTQ